MATRAETVAGGGRAARIAAGVAGAFLLWRGMLGRGRGRLLSLVAGALVLRRVLLGGAPEGKGSGLTGRPRRSPEVIEVKSPAELEPGIASASPKPTFPDRVDRGGS